MKRFPCSRRTPRLISHIPSVCASGRFQQYNHHQYHTHSQQHHLLLQDFWKSVLLLKMQPKSVSESSPSTPSSFPPPPASSTYNPAAARKLLNTALKTRGSSGGGGGDFIQSGGDVLPSLFAQQFCNFYSRLSLADKETLLGNLACDFGVDPDHIVRQSSLYATTLDGYKRGDKSDRALLNAEANLRSTLQPHYEILFTQIQRLSNGKRFLVDLRSNLLDLLRKNYAASAPPSSSSSTTPPSASLATNQLHHLRAMDANLKTLFQRWFTAPFMDLERITWNSPASVLEKIAEYEAVHPLDPENKWDDLRRRLGPRRLCYGFFHAALKYEPLTFVHCSLSNHVPSSIQSILNERHVEEIDWKQDKKNDTATFYSISSSQKGLAGVDLGNFLIKRVVQQLQLEQSHLKRFVTLSPIPGFRKWLDLHWMDNVDNSNRTPLLSSSMDGHEFRKEALLTPMEIIDLKNFFDCKEMDVIKKLKSTLAIDDWISNTPFVQVIQPILMRLCCRYLLKEKKRSLGLDKVLNFHIRNGACFDRLNWMGDVSSRGLKQSFGIMVNYHYVLSQIEANNQQYLLDGTISITSAATDSNQVDPYVMRAFSLSGKQEDEGGLYTISSSSVGGPAIKLRRVNVSLEQHTSKL